MGIDSLPPGTTDFLLELYKAHPELFKDLGVKGGIRVLKIVTAKLQENWGKVKDFFKGKRKDNQVPVALQQYIDTYIKLKVIANTEDCVLLEKYMMPGWYAIILLGYEARNAKLALNQERVREIKQDVKGSGVVEGLRLLNFVIQGYMEEIFIPMLKYQIGKLDSDAEILAWFTKFIFQQLAFFPRATWVTNSTSAHEIEADIRLRCVAKGFKDVNIHTIGDNNLTRVKHSLAVLGDDPTMPKFDYTVAEEIPKFYTISIKVL